MQDEILGGPLPGYVPPEPYKPEVVTEEMKAARAKFFKDNPDFEPC